jgi:hypothetical protein
LCLTELDAEVEKDKQTILEIHSMETYPNFRTKETDVTTGITTITEIDGIVTVKED